MGMRDAGQDRAAKIETKEQKATERTEKNLILSLGFLLLVLFGFGLNLRFRIWRKPCIGVYPQGIGRH
jgi:hypothetical protein